MWLLVAFSNSCPCSHSPWQPCESSRVAVCTPSAAAAVSVSGAAHCSTHYSTLMLFQADTSRRLCYRCETSAWLGKAHVGLHQAVVAEMAPAGAMELFCCLSSFIFAPSCSLVLCNKAHKLPWSSWEPVAIKS